MGVNVNWRESKQACYVDINHLGKRSAVPFSLTTYGTRPKAEKAAEGFAAQVRAKMKAAKFKLDAPEARITLQQLANETLTLQGNRKDSTMALYRSLLTNHLSPAPLARMMITAITPHDIKVFLNNVEGLAHSSTKTLLQAVQTVLSSAVERQLILRNPANRLRKAVRISDEERAAELEHLQVLTVDQVSDLLDGIAALHGAGSPLHTLFVLLSRTGLRIGEALALKWDCVNLASRTITVKRNISKGKLSTPKTHQRRDVAITPHLLAALTRLHTSSDAHAFVFANPRDGGFLKYRNVLTTTWDPATTTMRLGRITPHILRHTVASQLLAAHTSLLYVSQLLGHADPQFTLKVYGHLLPDDRANTLDVLDHEKIKEKANLHPQPRVQPQPRRNLRAVALRARVG
jgi:integrase